MQETLPHNNTATSIAAAQSASRTKVMQDRYDITEYCAKQGIRGASDDELARALPQINPNALRPRRLDCINFGTISDMAGERRATSSGAMAVVHHVTAYGLKMLKWPADSFCVDAGVK